MITQHTTGDNGTLLISLVNRGLIWHIKSATAEAVSMQHVCGCVHACLYFILASVQGQACMIVFIISFRGKQKERADSAEVDGQMTDRQTLWVR